MKLQQFTKLISKNVTVFSIASAFVLGAVGMSDIKDSLFDTSTWFMKSSETEQTEFENIADNTGDKPFDFGKSSAQSETSFSEETSDTSIEEPTTTEEPTITEATSSETSEETSEPAESTSDMTASESETSEAPEETEEPTKKTKKTKATEETTKAPSEDTTAAPAETTAAPVETTASPVETTAAPVETTAAPVETTAAPAPMGDTSGSYNADMAKQVLTLVNNERAANGLAPLDWGDSLAKAAKVRATEIVVRWDHVRPDGSQWYTVNENICFGENLAKGYSTPEDAMVGWMNSSGHKANILGKYNRLGVACYYCNGTYYWVQEFG